MRHDDQIYLQHMLVTSRKIQELSAGKSEAEFDEDEVLRLALLHLLQIVGEAASQVSAQFQTAWKTITDDVPALIRILEGRFGV